MSDFELRRNSSAAVITGAASGIGAAVALDLAARGTHLALADRDTEAAETTARRARQHGVRVSVHSLDVTDEAAVADLPTSVYEAHGGAHILVNCAGVSLLGSFEQLTLDEFKWLLDVNLWGTVSTTKRLLPLLRSQPTAHISNLSSGYGLIAPAGRTPYATSKFAIRGFTESIAHELAGTGVSVSVVHPGGIKTSIAMKARVAAAMPANIARAAAESQTAQYRTTPERAAQVIVDGITKRKARVLIGVDVKLLDALARITPAHSWRIINRALSKPTDTTPFER